MLMQNDPALAELHPVARAPLCALVNRASTELGLTIDVFDLYRSGTAQDAAFAAGASMKKAGASYHNLAYPNGTPCSLAAHVRVRLPGGAAVGFGASVLDPAGARHVSLSDWWEAGPGAPVPARLSARHLLYVSVGLLAEEIGWRIGGRWRTLQDWCHVEFHPDGATLEQVRATLAALGDIPGAAGLHT